MTTEIFEDAPGPADKNPNQVIQKPAPDAAAKHRWRGEGVVLNVFSHGFLAVWALMVAVPLLWALWSSFKTSGDILSHPGRCRCTRTWTAGRAPGPRRT